MHVGSDLSKMLGWWQCGRQRGREEAVAARVRVRGGREAGAGRWRSRPARAGGIASLLPTLERPPGREGGEREARHWQGESDVA
jgi:hypothetical protein